MFRASSAMSLQQFVLRGVILFFLAIAAFPCAEAAVAATDFGDPSDAPFVPRRGDAIVVPNAIHNLDTGELFDDLQSAIDDPDTLSGHTLQLEVLLQPEGLVAVTKSVTIQGQTGAETFQATVDTGSSGDARGWFLVESGIDVTVQDLIFDGAGFRIWQAFRVKGTGTFQRCSFNTIQFNTSTSYAGTAIATIGDIEVTDCVFTDIGRVGVLFNTSAVTAGLVQGCTYTGKGPGDWLDYMVEVGAGSYAMVHSNLAQACRGVASSDASESSGVNVNTVLGPGTTADVISNTLLDNTRGIQIGLPVDDGSIATVTYNRMIGNEFGIGVNAVNPLNAENNWFGCNEGPGFPGCDIEDGDVDIDPWLVLGISADPTILFPTEMSDVEGSLIFNSDSQDTSAGGNVPDNIPAAFTATLGTVNPMNTVTASGLIPTTFTAGMTLGIADVTVTLDNATVDTQIEIIPVPVELMAFSVE